MSQYIVSSTVDGSGYKYMENGRPVFGARDVAKFDAATASTVAAQLESFRGDLGLRALEVIGPHGLLDKFKTHAELASRMGCSLSTVGRWVKNDRVSVSYLAKAHALLQEQS